MAGNFFRRPDCSMVMVALILFFMNIPAFGFFTNNIAGACLDFQIDFADIFADNTQRQKLDTAQETNYRQCTGPTGNGTAKQSGNNGSDHQEETDERNQKAQAGDEADRADA